MEKEEVEQAVIDYLISRNLREGHYVTFQHLSAIYREHDCAPRDYVAVMENFAKSGYFEIVKERDVHHYITTKKGIDFIESQS